MYFCLYFHFITFLHLSTTFWIANDVKNLGLGSFPLGIETASRFDIENLNNKRIFSENFWDFSSGPILTKNSVLGLWKYFGGCSPCLQKLTKIFNWSKIKVLNVFPISNLFFDIKNEENRPFYLLGTSLGLLRHSFHGLLMTPHAPDQKLNRDSCLSKKWRLKVGKKYTQVSYT